MTRSTTINGFALLLLGASLAACTPMDFQAIPKSNGALDLPSPTPEPTPTSTPLPPPPQKASEYFNQDEYANKVDILIVNDNSYSMYEEQTKMAERFPSFVSALGDLDYQIAMTTTDLDSVKHNKKGAIMPWDGTGSNVLTKKTKDAEKAFKKTLKRQETIDCSSRREDCPSGNEQPLRAMMLAMDSRFDMNAGFFRERTDLAIIVLSDEDELSNGPATATKPKEVVDRFQAHFGTTKKFAVHGIIIKPGDTNCMKYQNDQTTTGNGAYYGTHVTELASLTGGSTESICDPDYSKSLEEISKQVRRLVGTFELQKTPRPGSVEVNLIPHATINWRLEGNKVIFDTPPPAGTRIEIAYLPQ